MEVVPVCPSQPAPACAGQPLGCVWTALPDSPDPGLCGTGGFLIPLVEQMPLSSWEGVLRGALPGAGGLLGCWLHCQQLA